MTKLNTHQRVIEKKRFLVCCKVHYFSECYLSSDLAALLCPLIDLSRTDGNVFLFFVCQNHMNRFLLNGQQSDVQFADGSKIGITIKSSYATGLVSFLPSGPHPSDFFGVKIRRG